MIAENESRETLPSTRPAISSSQEDSIAVLCNHAKTVGPQRAEHPLLLRAQCAACFITIARFTEDELEDFIATGEEERLGLYQPWCINEDALAVYKRSLKGDERTMPGTPVDALDLPDLSSHDVNFSMRTFFHVAHCRCSISIDHSPDGRNSEISSEPPSQRHEVIVAQSTVCNQICKITLDHHCARDGCQIEQIELREVEGAIPPDKPSDAYLEQMPKCSAVKFSGQRQLSFCQPQPHKPPKDRRLLRFKNFGSQKANELRTEHSKRSNLTNHLHLLSSRDSEEYIATSPSPPSSTDGFRALMETDLSPSDTKGDRSV